MATTDRFRTPPVHHLEKPHPTQRSYVKVALVLAVITGIEIAMSYIDMNKWALIISLLALSVVKFTLVVQWFMHLKFDHPTLRRPFVGGMAIALTVYTVVLVNLVYHSKG